MAHHSLSRLSAARTSVSLLRSSSSRVSFRFSSRSRALLRSPAHCSSPLHTARSSAIPTDTTRIGVNMSTLPSGIGPSLRTHAPPDLCLCSGMRQCSPERCTWCRRMAIELRARCAQLHAKFGALAMLVASPTNTAGGRVAPLSRDAVAASQISHLTRAHLSGRVGARWRSRV